MKDSRKIEDYLQNNCSMYEHVVVFGSYARGEAYSSSDVDILLIDDKFDGWTVRDIGDTSSVDFEWPSELPPIHIVTCSKEEFIHRYCDGGQMIENVVEDGYDVKKPFALVDFANSIDCENQ